VDRRRGGELLVRVFWREAPRLQPDRQGVADDDRHAHLEALTGSSGARGIVRA
jgi:hypothetical protein